MHPTRWIAPLLALATLSGPAFARAAAPPGIAALVGAIRANDITTLESIARGTAPPEQRALAHGTVLALRRDDAQAIAALQPMSRAPTDPTLRANALLVLASVYLREGRYRDCYDDIHSALELSPRSVHSGERQAMAFARALRSIPPMQILHAASGSLPFRRDRAGLIRVRVNIGARTQEAVLDTGANFSTISASTAQRAGVRMLPRAVTVGSSTKKSVPTQLGVARRVQIGAEVLSNVVFIVLPDSALTFPHGYRIPAIIGLPVLMRLERLEFSNSSAPTFSYGVRDGARPEHVDAHSNLLLAGLQPLVLAHVPGVPEPLRMELDSGANATGFAHNAVADARGLLRHAAQHALRFGGAGGVVTEHKALRLPHVALIIGGRRFTLQHVAVSSHSSVGSDGTIGEDILRQGSRWTLNFNTMTLRIEK